MSQLTIYLPGTLERQVKKEAKRSRKSLSAFMADLATEALRPPRWPKDFTKLYGSWGGKFPAIEDAPPEEP